MYVCVSVGWTVDLHDPIYGWKVEAARGQIGCEQDHVALAAELVVDLHAPQLIHRAVQTQCSHASLHASERLIYKFDLKLN